MLHLESSWATQDRLVWFSSPGSWDVLRAEFFSLGSRGPGCWMLRHSVLSAELSSHVPFHWWMQQLLQRQPCFENKQPLATTILLLKKERCALVYKIASYTYCLQGVERAFFRARYFKGKPVPAYAVPHCVVGLGYACVCVFVWKPVQSFPKVWHLTEVGHWFQMLLLLHVSVGSPVWSFMEFLRGSFPHSSLL